MNDGVIKFQSEEIVFDRGIFNEINTMQTMENLNILREQVRAKGWIGVDTSGIGYGNISAKLPTLDYKNAFMISGSQSAHLPNLKTENWAVVLDWNIALNSLQYFGAKASSESLSHAAIYDCDSRISVVLHVHDFALWNMDLASTPVDAEYGTPAMAQGIQKLWRQLGSPLQGVLRMAGHQDGVIFWGENRQQILEQMSLLSY